MSDSRWQPCDAVGPNGEKCQFRGKGHASPHEWEECDKMGPRGEFCHGVEPIGPEGFPQPSRKGHAGPCSFEKQK